MTPKKNNQLVIFFSSNSLNEIFSTHSFLIGKLSLNFDKLIFLNLRYLEFYIKNREILSEKFDYDLHSSFKIPDNSEIKNFKNTDDFEKFLQDKILIAININNFDTSLPSLKLLKYLNRFEIHNIEINDISNIKIKQKIEIKYFLKGLKFKFKKIFYNISIFLLSNFGLIKKIEIKFSSKKKNNFLEKYKDFIKLTNVIHHVTINSKAFDILNDENVNLKENKISLLDDFFGHPSSLKLRDKINQKDIDIHYNLLNNMLVFLSDKFKKEVVICIHPKDDLDLKKKIFSNFKVVKFKTRENILDSFIVLFFESSAIIDAILLNKKIITLYSPYNDDNVKNASNTYRDKIGILQINIKDKIESSSFDLVDMLEKKKENYRNFINRYVAPNGNKSGYKTIVETLKKNYF